jgi:hypothetical protein
MVGRMMIAASSTRAVGRTAPARQVSLARLLWVAPLTLVVALAACFAIRSIATSIDPNLARLPMLGQPMTTLVVEGVVAAVVVFAVFAVLLPRPIFWYRIVGSVALLLSLLPDIGLALGGSWMGLAMRYVGPLASLGVSGPGGGGPPPGGAPGGGAGGPPPGFFSGMSLDQVAVLMLLHIAVGVLCIGLLTTLTRRRAAQTI